MVLQVHLISKSDEVSKGHVIVNVINWWITFIDTESTTDCSPGSIDWSNCSFVIVNEHDLLQLC